MDMTPAPEKKETNGTPKPPLGAALIKAMPIIRTRTLFYLHALSAMALISVVVTIAPTAMPDYLCKLLGVAGLNIIGMIATKRDLVRLEGTSWWCYNAGTRCR